MVFNLRCQTSRSPSFRTYENRKEQNKTFSYLKAEKGIGQIISDRPHGVIHSLLDEQAGCLVANAINESSLGQSLLSFFQQPLAWKFTN
ncbi:hypothetical protein PoB_005515300 [Plakobranchus ocellatus]|uniref:Uncharacterized protein n=1 Tax=Plakobranchus ocellatus TaxID=259542 RepID=A0AAV4CCF3_9GAST|nr:hypothetical protein PoB_005515300 [Plakobranchus ocellatus]